MQGSERLVFLTLTHSWPVVEWEFDPENINSRTQTTTALGWHLQNMGPTTGPSHFKKDADRSKQVWQRDTRMEETENLIIWKALGVCRG